MEKFLFGILIGFCTLGVLQVIIPASLVYKSKAAIVECEKSLPRDQSCKIIAIPDIKETK